MRPKMVYEWDDKRDECYSLYITQNKSLEDVIEYYRQQNFAPSKRAFQARFKEWEFPAKHHRAHREEDLAVRIRELWEVNTGNQQMLEILRGEGWDVKSRELTKLRKDQGLLLREPNKNGNGSQKRKQRAALEQTGEQNGQQEAPESTEPSQKRYKIPNLPPDVAPEILAKRQARQARLLAESEERLKAGTRRRRTKVWSGLPPDPVAPPRYPTELTMEECKRELGLDKKMYAEMRNIFEDICRANNIIKKTLTAADTWKGIKEELISRVPHLQSLFWGPGAMSVNQTQQPMALELICMDVTKKIRTTGTRITISVAKNFLRLTPQEGRDIRSAFDTILKQDYFVSKLEVPREHWDGLKTKWIEGSPLLQEKLSGGEADPDYATKLRCLESIAADVQKRHRDQQTKNDPAHLTKSLNPPQASSTNKTSRPSQSSGHQITAPPPSNQPSAPYPPGKSTNPPAPKPNNKQTFGNGSRTETTNDFRFPQNTVPSNGMSALASQALASASDPPFIDYGDMQGMQIDPTLLEAAALPQRDESYSNIPMSNTTSTIQTAIPVYFRISPYSSLQLLATHPKVWLNTLNPPYMVDSLKQLALGKLGAGHQARVQKIEGVATRDGNGGEGGSKWSIDEDDELEAYLEMVGNGKATFVVEIS